MNGKLVRSWLGEVPLPTPARRILDSDDSCTVVGTLLFR